MKALLGRIAAIAILGILFVFLVLPWLFWLLPLLALPILYSWRRTVPREILGFLGGLSGVAAFLWAQILVSEGTGLPKALDDFLVLGVSASDELSTMSSLPFVAPAVGVAGTVVAAAVLGISLEALLARFRLLSKVISLFATVSVTGLGWHMFRQTEHPIAGICVAWTGVMTAGYLAGSDSEALKRWVTAIPPGDRPDHAG